MGHKHSKAIRLKDTKTPEDIMTLEDVIKDVQQEYTVEMRKLLFYLDQNLKKKIFRADIYFCWGSLFKIPLGCEKQAVRDIQRHLDSLGFDNVIVELSPHKEYCRYNVDIFSRLLTYQEDQNKN